MLTHFNHEEWQKFREDCDFYAWQAEELANACEKAMAIIARRCKNEKRSIAREALMRLPICRQCKINWSCATAKHLWRPARETLDLRLARFANSRCGRNRQKPILWSTQTKMRQTISESGAFNFHGIRFLLQPRQIRLRRVDVGL
jgi:hypothetical protein